MGLGKIGLPLAVQYANKGFEVVGVDVNHATVGAVNAKREPFPGEEDLQEQLARVVGAGYLRATDDYTEAIPASDVIVVVVPLFVDQDDQPDFGWMDSATASIAKSLTTGSLVIYETTLPVGTTRSRWKPLLEKGSGLVAGKDFEVAFSPERVLTGRVFADLRKYPKLVGGLTTRASEAAEAFYRKVLDFDDRPDLDRPNGVWDLGSAEAAEMAKLVETTYRDVNIGLANEFAGFAEHAGIDIYSVIAAANSQPYSHIHNPGISVGGHCIPVYPRLYLFSHPSAQIVRTARGVNAAAPRAAIDRLEQHVGDLAHASVAVLGAAYRGGVKETAFSGAFDLVRLLKERHARPQVHDPLYSSDELRSLGFAPYELGNEIDLAIIHTDHDLYRTLAPSDVPGARIILDGRNILNPRNFSASSIITLGLGE